MRPTLIAGIANLAVIAVLALSACDNQQELCFDHNHDRVPVEVVFDWSECPDAEPSTMSLYLFSEEGSQPRRFDLNGRNGGMIEVLKGRYSVVALNSDIENTAVRYSSGIESFELFLRSSFSTYSPGLCNPSDMVWIGVEEDVAVNGDTLRLLMRKKVCRCEVDVRRLSNNNNLRSAIAHLSGFNESVSGIGGKGTMDRVSIGFELELDTDSSLHAEILTLGHCGQVRSRDISTRSDSLHLIDINFTLSDGSSWIYSEDVTDQIHRQTNEYCHIVIDSIILPKTNDSPSGGFAVGVDEWDTIEFTIKP